MPNCLTLALSKGRIYKETLPLLKLVGIEPIEDLGISRKLILETNKPDIRLISVRAFDVPVYVEYGGADIGITGKDVLLEHPKADIYEPVDLKIACCKLMTAGQVNADIKSGRWKIATKFVETTRRFYAEKGQQVEIIKLHGSMELAPLVGIADRIVDVVDTGNTLRANGLEPIEHIADISSCLVVNKASMKVKHTQIRKLVNQIYDIVRDQNNG